ncbi:MAG: hypothetical protein ACK559_28760, partial [bacterium]
MLQPPSSGRTDSMTQDPSGTGQPVPKAPAEPIPLSSGETVFYEGGPARGDLILSLLIGLTLIGLPIAVGAV